MKRSSKKIIMTLESLTFSKILFLIETSQFLKTWKKSLILFLIPTINMIFYSWPIINKVNNQSNDKNILLTYFAPKYIYKLIWIFIFNMCIFLNGCTNTRIYVPSVYIYIYIHNIYTIYIYIYIYIRYIYIFVYIIISVNHVYNIYICIYSDEMGCFLCAL